MTQSYADWQRESIHCIEKSTPCEMHRYETVYICSCGKLVSHSQGDWNKHRLHPNGISILSEYYCHGDTALDLFDRMQVYGLLPYGTKEYDRVYSAMADLQWETRK